jgi:hypothetical protein
VVGIEFAPDEVGLGHEGESYDVSRHAVRVSFDGEHRPIVKVAVKSLTPGHEEPKEIVHRAQIGVGRALGVQNLHRIDDVGVLLDHLEAVGLDAVGALVGERFPATVLGVVVGTQKVSPPDAIARRCSSETRSTPPSEINRSNLASIESVESHHRAIASRTSSRVAGGLAEELGAAPAERGTLRGLARIARGKPW